MLTNASLEWGTMQRLGRAVVSVALVLVTTASLAPASALAGGGRGGNVAHAAQELRPVVKVIDPVALPAAGMTRGVDVSHWQGVIEWRQVRAAGVAFAYLKATEGTTYIDHFHGVNALSARAAGIAVGAYHYAQPSLEPGDATAEADHFLAVAAPRPGDLLPVLDLEETGGLSPEALTAWTTAFVARIRERLGVSPMIYVSPAFWTSGLDDSVLAAFWGAPLWLAHWQTGSPRVPADDWRGRGWTIWQWSKRGLVPGIDGEVDLDVLSGHDLAVIRLP